MYTSKEDSFNISINKVLRIEEAQQKQKMLKLPARVSQLPRLRLLARLDLILLKIQI
jgi:hypothetical protein